MKKLFSILAIACMAVSVLTSCGKKNDPVNPAEDTVAAFAGIHFEAVFDTLTVEQCDISFDFYDENGEKKNEKVTTKVWKKSVRSASLPATLGFHWNIAPKRDLDTTKYESFYVGYQFKYHSAAYNAEGISVSTPKTADFGNGVGVEMSVREQTVEIILRHNPVNFIHLYDAQGNVTEEEWK